MNTNTMELIGVHPVKHSDLGFNNTLFGGKLLYWLDGDSVAYAMQLCDTPEWLRYQSINVHLKSLQALVILLRSMHQSMLSELLLLLNVEARRHNVYTGQQNIILATDIKFVKVDEEGNPLPLEQKAINRFNKMQQEKLVKE